MASQEGSSSSSLTKKRGGCVISLLVHPSFDEDRLARHRGLQHHRVHCPCTFQGLGCDKNHREERMVWIDSLRCSQDTRRLLSCVVQVIVPRSMIPIEQNPIIIQPNDAQKRQMKVLMRKYAERIKVWCTSTSNRYTNTKTARSALES